MPLVDIHSSVALTKILGCSFTRRGVHNRHISPKCFTSAFALDLYEPWRCSNSKSVNVDDGNVDFFDF